MSRLLEIRATSRWPDIIEGQPQHLGIAAFMTAGALSLLADDGPGFGAAEMAALSIWLAVVHQVIVAAVFRLQLHRDLMTRLFGDRDLLVWKAVFLPLLILRPLTILTAGLIDGTPIPGPWLLWLVLGLAFLAAAGWTLHSVIVHFTIQRAVGGDHFRDSIAAMPLVREGAFRHMPNAMYGLAFLGLWGIALVCDSRNALVAAAFQHAYIWVHMAFTERPDMDWIYGDRLRPSTTS